MERGEVLFSRLFECYKSSLLYVIGKQGRLACVHMGRVEGCASDQSKPDVSFSLIRERGQTQVYSGQEGKHGPKNKTIVQQRRVTFPEISI